MMSEPVVLLLGVGVVTSGKFTQPSSMSAVMTGESRPGRTGTNNLLSLEPGWGLI